MKEVMGNLWEWSLNQSIVIPTNIGWKNDGSNPMGAGIAREVKERYPDVPAWLGTQYQAGYHCVLSHPSLPLIFFPTKPLNVEKPYLSWKNDADLVLVEQSAMQLTRFEGKIALPLVGCGRGRLRPGKVIPLLRGILVDDRFMLVHSKRPPSYLYRHGVEYPS